MAITTTLNIASYLTLMAERQPDALAVAVQRRSGDRFVYEKLTARVLEDESNRVARGLETIGIGRGTRTVLMVTPGVEFFVLTFALFKAGAVPVMVDPGMGVRNLKDCLDEAAPEAFIGVPKAHAARVILGWAKHSVRICVTVGRRLFWGGYAYEDLKTNDVDCLAADTRPGETAAILFTSGSTGAPKGAVYTHAIFDAQVAALRDHYGIEPGERDLATFPLFALFGPALGMASIVPDMDASRPITADPDNLFAAIRDFQTTNLFASPALIERLGRAGAARGIKLPCLRRVISAGAPARAGSIRRFVQLLDPGVEVFPSYGATEALPLCSIGSAEFLEDTAAKTDQGAGVCVGRPIGDVTVRIIPITDAIIETWSDDLPVPPGEIGEICVAGPVVTRAYYNRSDATARAKIYGPEEGAVWHRMGDVGYFDDRGRLWYCGRKAHRVVAGEKTLFTLPCERIFDTHPAVRRTALVGVARDGTTRPVLCVELERRAGRAEQRRIASELLALAKRYDHTKTIESVLFHPQFPVDVRHNAKIFRERLAEWASTRVR